MSKCAKYEDILARYLHGGVILQEREELEQHLAVCPSCEKLYAETAEADRLLRQYEEKIVDPPAHLHGRILANLPEAAGGTAWRTWGRWAAGFAAAAACALIVFAVSRETGVERTRVARAPSPPQAAAPPAPGGGAEGKKEAPPKAATAPPAARTGRTAVAAAPKVRIIREVRIFFYYPPASKVAVTGDFNGWNPEGVPLKAAGKPGLWETTLRLPPGAYSYNFIVDGNILLPDPNAPNQMPDGYGGTDSILLVKGGNSV